MDQNTIILLMLGLMLVAITSGVHIAFAFGITAFIGNWIMFEEFDVALASAGNVAYEQLRSEVFATIPLFILMGDFVSRSGSARDLYNIINHGLKLVPGRLAVATVAGNAVFAAVTGVSIAAAAAFSRIAYPQMRHHGYSRTFALGSVAGSACLGMLIPPSVLMIVWGIITEKSISQLFIAGAIPGLLLSAFFIAYTVIWAKMRPDVVPKVDRMDDDDQQLSRAEVISGIGILVLILMVLGGIWGGLFTPTEAGGVGAICAMILGLIKGMKARAFVHAVIDAGKTAAPIMLLLLTAAMYAKFLAAAGISDLIQAAFSSFQLGEFGIVMVMVIIWLILGMILDSISIILLTVPIFAPVAEAVGFDPIAFGIFGILAIEAGLLTPPFGLLVYTVKGAVDDAVTLSEIFAGSIPYWILMLVVMTMIWIWPEIALWLPRLAIS
ncbi:MAG: TRAP transporter large permease [Rhodospirillales bacterium]|nr:TRAP transporter large permease [Rhodospirillales bacterium]